MKKEIGINDIIKAGFGETSNDLRVTFRKAVNVAPYETETFEAETVLKIDKEITGGERMAIMALAEAQLEYKVFVGLLSKNLIDQKEFDKRRERLEYEMTLMYTKIHNVFPEIDIDRFFKDQLEIDETSEK